jgi:hypothetical protein
MSPQKDVDQIDARKLVGLLADEERLRVSAALALGASSLDGICNMTGLDRRVAGRALGQLMAGGLAEDEAASGLRLRTELFRLATRHSPSGGEPDSLADLFPNGRLPRSRQRRLAVLHRLAALFDPEYRYPEAEVNARLSRVNADYALLRRLLVDQSLLLRANEVAPGGRTIMVYWRAGRTVVAADDHKA